MAIWRIERQRNGAHRVVYLPVDREREPVYCGTESASTPGQAVLDWVLCEAAPGDFVLLAAGSLTLFVQQAATG